MAYYFGLSVGEGPGYDNATGKGIKEQSTTTSKDIEVVINTTANVPSKEDLVKCVQLISDYIIAKDKGW